MGWIKNRIKAENRKHKDLDWESFAEIKILSSLNDFIDSTFADMEALLRHRFEPEEWFDDVIEEVDSYSKDLKKRIKEGKLR